MSVEARHVGLDDMPPDPHREIDFPEVGLPVAPSARSVWARAGVLLSIIFALFLLDRLALLLMDYWLLQSMGFESVFWTNFWTGAALFGVSLVLTTAAVAAPAYAHRLPPATRRKALAFGLFVGLLDDVIIGVIFASRFRDFLLFANAQPFGEVDPVFGHDLGFYIFRLPAMWLTWQELMWVFGIGLVSSVVCAWLARDTAAVRDSARPRFLHLLGVVSTPWTRAMLALFAVVTAVGVWLSRYELLTKDNSGSSVYRGAEALDVTGVVNTVNLITVEVIALLLAAVGLWWKLGQLHRAVTDPDDDAPHTGWRGVGVAGLAAALLPGLVLGAAFAGLVAARDHLAIGPNEPVVQLEQIGHHIEATRKAFGLDRVETVEFEPNGPDDPLPDADALLDSPTLRNAPLWPSFTSRLERVLDPQHAERVFLTGGNTTIYSPTSQVFTQEQKLRPYYDFLDIDSVRYNYGGEPHLVASAVRELPLVEPKPWLAWWGQQYLLFTHGYGLVMADVAGKTADGGPALVSQDIPPETTQPELATDNPAIYYGEGSGSMAYSNVQGFDEFDYPTEQGRAETRYPEGVGTGVPMDSFIKRLVFGYKSKQFLDVTFSNLITDETRVHYFRTPLERLEHLAPFLYLDTDPYAVAADGGVTWMINGMTTTDRYPYSMHQDIGDKSDERSPTSRPHRKVNYVADSVKATVDAFTGQPRLYQWADEPVVNAWAAIYPDLFEPREEMPEAAMDHVQYPIQLMHIQFDDLYIYYHMTDPLEFFNLEDLWDDGDEVLGPVLDSGDAITFSIEPYHWIAETGGVLPVSPGPGTQFATSMIFTPENATNLRSIVTAYQERGDYGRLIALNVPKGEFVLGPEQADSAIDQDPALGAQFSLWNRTGAEVIRGHTVPLVIDGEVIYLEPIFLRSEQNPTPELAQIVAVIRGSVGVGQTLEEAVRDAVAAAGSPDSAVVVPTEDEDEEGEGGGPPPGRGPGSGEDEDEDG